MIVLCDWFDSIWLYLKGSDWIWLDVIGSEWIWMDLIGRRSYRDYGDKMQYEGPFNFQSEEELPKLAQKLKDIKADGGKKKIKRKKKTLGRYGRGVRERGWENWITLSSLRAQCDRVKAFLWEKSALQDVSVETNKNEGGLVFFFWRVGIYNIYIYCHFVVVETEKKRFDKKYPS